MQLDSNGYYALGVPIYLAAAAGEIWVARRRGLRVYRFADTIGNLAGGLGEVVIGLFLGVGLLALYDFGLKNFALVHWPREWVIAEWVAAFLLGDFCYYLYHRASHRCALFWAVHGVHHQSEELNLSVALRNPWFSDFYSFLFYWPLTVIGIGGGKFFLAISLISLYAVTIHSRVLHRPGFWIFTTPRTHIVHHAMNKRYLHKNFGALFTLWDRMFGSHVEVVPEDPPRLGTLWSYETHDGAWSQWIFFQKTHAAARRAKTLREWLRVWFGRPGWLPSGTTRPAAIRPPRDEQIPFAVKAYAGAQFAWITVMALAVLWFRDHHGLLTQVAVAALVLWGTSTIGGLLDGRPVFAAEAVRVTLTALLGASLAPEPAYSAAGTALLAASVASAGGLVVLAREPSTLAGAGER